MAAIAWLGAGPFAPPAAAQGMVDQNLFAPNRKPPAPPKAAPVHRQNIDEVRQAKVLGIMTLGPDRSALVEAPAKTFETKSKDAQVIKVWVREKEMIGEFVVERIEPDKVRLRRGEETLVLEDRNRHRRLGREAKPFAPAKEAARP